MTPADRHARVTALFHDALERDAQEREDWLASACVEIDLLEEVRSMLSQQKAGESGVLDQPLLPRSNDLIDTNGGTFADPMIGRKIGPWQIEERLGEGGMGVVYSAERADGLYKRTVALKLLRHGPDMQALAHRLAGERQILARLEHDGIARLYDGGVTEEGLPYLAIERVDGDNVTAWSENHLLDTDARIQLFLQICDAVAYAHRNLVIHRDLKPSNILVARKSNGEPRVKLLDFGIAKLMEEDGESGLTRTAIGAMTPSYAAPEQFKGEPVTTATDVYALGVVLYELLVGKRPYELGTLTAAQAERVVCESEPPKPSRAEAAPRAHQLAGDLDQIVLKALAKEPENRYASVDALSLDLQRHIDGIPVEARPATAGYRLRKFAKRNRAAVTATAAAFLLVATLVTFFMLRLASERNQAELAAEEAVEHAERSEAISGFLEQILQAPNTNWYVEGEATGPDTPIRAVLDEAAERIDQDFADRPDLRADLYTILGDTYGSLGLTDETRRYRLTVLALRESLLTAPHPKIAEAMYFASLKGADEVDVPLLERAVTMQRLRNEGNNFPFMLTQLAETYLSAERYEEAELLLREALVFVDEAFVPGHEGFRYRDPLLATITRQLGLAQTNLGNLGGAERWFARGDSVLALLPRHAGHVMTWRHGMCNRGKLLRLQGRFHEAEAALLACFGDNDTRATPSPFQGGYELEAWRARNYQGQASADLVPLYQAWNRPEEATRFQARAREYHMRQDSVRAVMEEMAHL